MEEYTLRFENVCMKDVGRVGGKNASLGEMIQNLKKISVEVPPGFATTSFAFKEFLRINGLDAKIKERLLKCDVNNVESLSSTSYDIRKWIVQGKLPKQLELNIRNELKHLSNSYGNSEDDDNTYAIRSSATAEDLGDASFAGQQATYLNVQGIENILIKVKLVYASLYLDRAIHYRSEGNYGDVYLSVGIQKMVKSSLSSSGVLFSVDTESGNKNVAIINSSYGLGEMVVQGAVNPDEWMVFKPSNTIVKRTLGSKETKMIFQSDFAKDLQQRTKAAESAHALVLPEIENTAIGNIIKGEIIGDAAADYNDHEPLIETIERCDAFDMDDVLQPAALTALSDSQLGLLNVSGSLIGERREHMLAKEHPLKHLHTHLDEKGSSTSSYDTKTNTQKDLVKAQKADVDYASMTEESKLQLFEDDAEASAEVIAVPVPTSMRRRYSLTDHQVRELCMHAKTIESHYGRPMDIEWALDSVEQKLYIVQARPETVASHDDMSHISMYHLREDLETVNLDVIVEGSAIGRRIGHGIAKVLRSSSSSEMSRVKKGDIIVCDMTTPSFEPVLRIISGLICNRGGRTCHAAIVAREKSLPVIVGAANATELITDGTKVTLDCSRGQRGYVYKGALDYTLDEEVIDTTSKLPITLKLIANSPQSAFNLSMLPSDGIGLLRLEFILSSIAIHPLAAIFFDTIQDEGAKNQITKTLLDAGYLPHKRIIPYLTSTPSSSTSSLSSSSFDTRNAAAESPLAHKVTLTSQSCITYYLNELTSGIACFTAAFYPRPVTLRLSDLKSNEYRGLIGGAQFEPQEENPMLGLRGASRYLSPSYKSIFEMELQAIKRVVNSGMNNIRILVPFVRSTQEMEVVSNMVKTALHPIDIPVYMMCELPCNALNADNFLSKIDGGMSIGTNDLTQLTLGIDRDAGSEALVKTFNEQDISVRALIKMAINACKRHGRDVATCGQGPSDSATYLLWLVESGIDSVAVNPDALLKSRKILLGDHSGMLKEKRSRMTINTAPDTSSKSE